jgi:hypothetical protein
VASSPEAFNQKLRSVMDEGAEATTAFRDSLKRTILNSDDPVQELNRWQNNNPQALDWLYPSSGDSQALDWLYPRAGDLEQARKTARELKYLNESPAADYVDRARVRVGVARETLQAKLRDYPVDLVRKSPADQAARVMRNATPEERSAYREMVFTDALEGAVYLDEASGLPRLDHKKLTENIKRAKDSGTFEGILTERDQKLLETAARFAKRAKVGDTGAALAVASQMGQIRRLDPGAVANIAWSARLARIFTDTSLPGETLFAKLTDDPLTDKKFNVVLSGVNRGIRSMVTTEAEQQGPQGPVSLPPELPAVPPGQAPNGP